MTYTLWPGPMVLVRTLTLLSLGLPLLLIWTLETDPWLQIFWTLFVLRYARFIGHSIAYWAYRPDPISDTPAFLRSDVTVILPTVDPTGPDFLPCVRSILRNAPHTLLVVTVGPNLLSSCKDVLRTVIDEDSETRIMVSAVPRPSKRRQVAHAMPQVKTSITILADDHVFWPSLNFLPSVLAPFEDRNVGVVATKKRVLQTTPGEWSWASCVNFIACNYLQRHNWELRASNAIDGGVFVVSGRTAAYRTDFLQDSDLLTRFCHEVFCFGLFGGEGLGPDDDNFLTREAMKKGWYIRFQDTEDGTIETTLGKHLHRRLLRWGRTTFRSNGVMLRDPKFLYRYTWSYFMVYWAGITNFALFWDAALIATLVQAESFHPTFIFALFLWIFFTKAVKILPHFMRHPADLALLPVQFAFAYIHSFFKLWALLTFWDCDWSGRKLDEIANAEMQHGTTFQLILPDIAEEQ